MSFQDKDGNVADSGESNPESQAPQQTTTETEHVKNVAQNPNSLEGAPSSQCGKKDEDSGESNSESPAKRQKVPEDCKKALKGVKNEERCCQLIEDWIEKGVDPEQIVELIQLIRKEEKPSWSLASLTSRSSLPSSRPSVTVSYVVTGETFGAHETIIEQLKHNVKFIKLEPESRYQNIIVFCPITSRAGSDVAAAMSDPLVSASDKPVFLVLMHHTRDVDYCTAEGNCSEKFPRVKTEVHLLFHETQPGLLDCTRNSQAINKLKKAILCSKQHSIFSGILPQPSKLEIG